MYKRVAAVVGIFLCFTALWIVVALSIVGPVNATSRREQPDSPLPTVAPTPTPFATISPDESPWSSQNLELARTYAFTGSEWLEHSDRAASSPQHNKLLYSDSYSFYDWATKTFTFTMRPLILVDMDRNETREIGVGTGASWSPSGEKAIFSDYDSDTKEWGLSIFDLTTGEMRRLARFNVDDIYRDGPFWISEEAVVISIGSLYDKTSFLVDTNTGESELLFSPYLQNWFRYHGATSPTVVDASAASDTILVKANDILYLLQHNNDSYGGYVVSHLLGSSTDVNPEFEPQGPALLYGNDFTWSTVFTPGFEETRSMQIPRSSMSGGTYFWTPDGAALLIMGRQGSAWGIVNRDGSGSRGLEGTEDVSSVTMTRNYLILKKGSGANVVYRVAGTR